MKRKNLTAVIHGKIAIEELSREEQRSFYLSMLYRIAELTKSKEGG